MSGLLGEIRGGVVVRLGRRGGLSGSSCSDEQGQVGEGGFGCVRTGMQYTDVTRFIQELTGNSEKTESVARGSQRSGASEGGGNSGNFGRGQGSFRKGGGRDGSRPGGGTGLGGGDGLGVGLGGTVGRGLEGAVNSVKGLSMLGTKVPPPTSAPSVMAVSQIESTEGFTGTEKKEKFRGNGQRGGKGGKGGVSGRVTGGGGGGSGSGSGAGGGGGVRGRSLASRQNLSPLQKRNSGGVGSVPLAAGKKRGLLADDGKNDGDGNSWVSGDSDEEGEEGMPVKVRKKEREKRRRETMNSRFSELALMIPRTTNGKADKETILAEAIENAKRQSNSILELNLEKQALKREVEDLRAEKAELRTDKNYLRAELEAAREEVKSVRDDLLTLWQIYKQQVSSSLQNLLPLASTIPCSFHLFVTTLLFKRKHASTRFNGRSCYRVRGLNVLLFVLGFSCGNKQMGKGEGGVSGKSAEGMLETALRSKILGSLDSQELKQMLHRSDNGDRSGSHNECA